MHKLLAAVGYGAYPNSQLPTRSCTVKLRLHGTWSIECQDQILPISKGGLLAVN